MLMGYVCEQCNGIFNSVTECVSHERICKGGYEPKDRKEYSVECTKCGRNLSVKAILDISSPDRKHKDAVGRNCNPFNSPAFQYYKSVCPHCRSILHITVTYSPMKVVLNDEDGNACSEGWIDIRRM